MQKTTRSIAIICLVFGAFLLAGVVFQLFLSNEVVLPVPPEIVAAVSASDTPLRIEIPTLNVEASVQHVGLLEGNRMESPKGLENVGWYMYGPAPGAVGSAVIAGHLDNALGLKGVFTDLEKLSVGDRVVVHTKEGKMLAFIVEKKEYYPFDAVPSEVFLPRDAIRLNIVTCAGEWMPKTGERRATYSERLVVFTKLETF